jgi:hypothetical protein
MRGDSFMNLNQGTIDELRRISVLDENNNSIEIGSFWQDQRAALIFVRHFG